MYRKAKFATTGEFTGEREQAMAGTTVEEAARSLGKTMWDSYGFSAFHEKGDRGRPLRTELKDLLTAMKNVSPNKKIQKAITPDLLNCMAIYTGSTIDNDPEQHAADLIIGGFFFACRSCEFAKTPRPGVTVTIYLGGIKFFAEDRTEISHDHPELLEIAMYVWILFENQKTRYKFKSRTQKRTKHKRLCPVRRFGRAVIRVRRFCVGVNERTPICSINNSKYKSDRITQAYTCSLLRRVCRIFGGEERFGFRPDEIGNKSIRSGAAMALFLKDCSPEKIMILGRWRSKAYLDYIRPQVAELTDLLSSDMILFENFF